MLVNVLLRDYATYRSGDFAKGFASLFTRFLSAMHASLRIIFLWFREHSNGNGTLHAQMATLSELLSKRRRQSPPLSDEEESALR